MDAAVKDASVGPGVAGGSGSAGVAGGEVGAKGGTAAADAGTEGLDGGVSDLVADRPADAAMAGAGGNGGVGGSAGARGDGGASATGGTSEIGGTSTTGGMGGTGGTSGIGTRVDAGIDVPLGGTGGASGSGSAGTGGAATDGAVGGTTGGGGTGGTMTACQSSATQCSSSTSLETCSNGQWGAAVACSSGLVCERYPPAACEDPNWAEWPLPDSPGYVDNGNETVSDNAIGLMWQKAAPTAMYTWTDAVAYCPTLTLGSHEDWRLPSLIELASLVDYGVAVPGPTINSTVFPGTPANVFWSSTPMAGSASAWYVNFNDGSVFFDAVPSKGLVRCVR